MNNSQSTLLINKSAIFKDSSHLKLNSFNESQLKDILPEGLTRTAKGNKNKKISLVAEEKEKLTRKALNFSNNGCQITRPITNLKNFNTESKENKFSFLKELDMDSVSRSNLQDSKSSLDRSSIIRVYEELADIKHQLSKQQNENKVCLIMYYRF
jgi:hypothetical protein